MFLIFLQIFFQVFWHTSLHLILSLKYPVWLMISTKTDSSPVAMPSMPAFVLEMHKSTHLPLGSFGDTEPQHMKLSGTVGQSRPGKHWRAP